MPAVDLFPQLPADLTSLSDEALQAAIDEHRTIAAAIQRRDADVIGDMSTTEVVEQLTAGVAQYEALTAESVAREEQREAAAVELEALSARMGIEADATPDGADAPDAADDDAAKADDDDDAAKGDDDDAEKAETEVVGQPEAVTAAAVVRRRVPLRRALEATPVEREEAREESRTVITASTDIPGRAAGSHMTDITEVTAALLQRRAAIGQTPAGMSESIRVARIERRYDEAETLGANVDENWGKVHAALERRIAPEALVASGGLCAPVTPYYDLEQISTDARPVRDALARFNASRGGIRSATPPTIADITTGVGVMTAANDAVGGTTATKTCQRIECPDFSEVDVQAIYYCLLVGNMGARAWPEQVRQFTELLMAAHASEAETQLLDAIKSYSTQVTATASLGAVASLLGQILTAAVGMRSRHRMGERATLRIMLPSWAADMLIVDLLRSQFNRFDQTQAGLIAFLRTQGLEPSFYLDSASGDGQVFGTQSAGALLNFPSTVKWYLFPENSFLWLDAGTLDLGLVRDSTLNATNDYSIFGETFEEVAFIGVESIHVTSTVCPSGETAGNVDVTCPVL